MGKTERFTDIYTMVYLAISGAACYDKRTIPNRPHSFLGGGCGSANESGDRSMKQIVALLLALVMAFSLCACGGSSSGAAGSDKDSAAAATSEPAAVDQDEEDYKAALALMDAGKLEDAIAAFEALDGYQDSADKIKDDSIIENLKQD